MSKKRKKQAKDEADRKAPAHSERIPLRSIAMILGVLALVPAVAMLRGCSRQRAELQPRLSSGQVQAGGAPGSPQAVGMPQGTAASSRNFKMVGGFKVNQAPVGDAPGK